MRRRRPTADIRGLLLLALLAPPLAAAEPDYNLERAKRLFKTGWTHYQRGNYPLAIETLHRAVAAKPTFAPARVWLGEAYLQAGYPENAAEEWRTALDLGLGDNLLRQRLAFLTGQAAPRPRFDPVADYEPLASFLGHRLRRGFHKPASLAGLGDNRIAVAGFLSRNVLLLDINGERTAALNPGPLKPFRNPYGIAAAPDGTLWVTDFGRDRILRFDRQGRKLAEFGTSGITNAAFAGPEGVAVDRHGMVYVVDNGNGRVQKFTPDGTWLMTVGTKGRGPDHLYRPSGIALDDQGRLYVGDTGNRRVQVFDADGVHLRSIGEGLLTAPRGLRVRGDLLVVADGPAGLFFHDLRRDLSWTRNYWRAGEFRLADAVDIEFDPERDTLAVADFGRNSVDILAPAVFRHSDLHVRIRRIHTGTWPRITAFVSVLTPDGRRVEGLTPANFKVSEDNLPVPLVSLVRDFHNSTSFLFVVERTPSTARFPLELRSAAERILDPRTPRDRFKVLNAGDRVWTGLDWSQSRLTILGRVESDRTTDRTRLGKGLYAAVAELVPLHQNKAIVLFTSGDWNPDEAFQEYAPETVAAFAKAHGIPIHIVAFTEENRDLLESLARSTGGRYVPYFTHAKILPEIHAAVTGRSPPEYLLTWTTTRGTDKPKWRDLQVRVDVRGLTGIDRSGYFLP